MDVPPREKYYLPMARREWDEYKSKNYLTMSLVSSTEVDYDDHNHKLWYRYARGLCLTAQCTIIPHRHAVVTLLPTTTSILHIISIFSNDRTYNTRSPDKTVDTKFHEYTYNIRTRLTENMIEIRVAATPNPAHTVRIHKLYSSAYCYTAAVA